MLKETKTEETMDVFVTFLSLVSFQLDRMPGPPGLSFAFASPMSEGKKPVHLNSILPVPSHT